MDYDYKFIHLLYVPTMACNMACKYCYLEDNTIDEFANFKPLDTLEFAINKFRQSKVIPFNISLHGGEVTTLSKSNFRDLIKYISDYYKENFDLIKSNGFPVGTPHIKTNLYGIERHIDTIKEFNVSISGSLDLPFALHDKYRVTKGGQSTLKKIFDNINLLSGLPNKKKVSATIFKEHFNLLDSIVSDIKRLHSETCLDMNDFNFMIGFDYNSNGILHAMTEDEQVEFFNRMHKEFDGTDLESGVNGAWFNEFGPDYCTNCDNCGEKFFLLEKNGDIYSCVRGQKHPDFYFGNIYKNSVEEILNTAKEKMFINHNNFPISEECANCGYLYICKTGCPFVKNLYKNNMSYTCKLQKELYKKRGYEEIHNEVSTYNYILKMFPKEAFKYLPTYKRTDMPDLRDLILQDEKLKYIYDENSFILKVDNFEYKLKSQILRKTKEIVYLTDDSRVNIYIKKNILNEVSDFPENNSLFIILLSGDLIKYGDEGRVKQKHIMSHQVYKNVLESNYSDKDEFYQYDITNLLKQYYKYLDKNKPNNIFFTTNDLRNYHYIKQKNNAYYHLQAINLPFQNMEFIYIGEE